MDPTCTKRVIMPNPCNSWNPWLLLEVPEHLPLEGRIGYSEYGLLTGLIARGTPAA